MGRIYWFLALGWAGLIFFSSSLSIPPTPPTIPFQDKVVHFVLYGVLAGLLFGGFFRQRGWLTINAAFWAFLLASLYGVTDELHQLFVPLRQCDVFDWLADTGGALVSVAILAALITKYHQTKSTVQSL